MMMILMEIQTRVVMNLFVFAPDLRERNKSLPIENNHANDTENTVKVTTDGPEAQEIDGQSDSDSLQIS